MPPTAAAALREHNFRYHSLNSPTISDAQYDSLKAQAVADGHTPATVGAPPPQDVPTVPHRAPMLSLNSTTDPDALRAWHASTLAILDVPAAEFVASPKIDGLAVSILYRRGELAQASTRGDGHTGQDVTAAVRTILSVPLGLDASVAPVPDLLEVRGEAYFAPDDFDILNDRRREDGLPPFANARNAAAGSVRLADPDEAAERPLAFLAYGIGLCDGVSCPTYAAQLSLLTALGFPQMMHHVCPDLQRALDCWDDLSDRRDGLLFEIDGMVLAANRLDHQATLGSGTTAPHYAIAIKFAPAATATVIRAIDFSVSRTGRITPIAVFDPIRVAGATLRRASLYNQANIDWLDIRIGDAVTIERSGGCTPVVTAVLRERRTGTEIPARVPDRCPGCGAPVHTVKGFQVCSNP